MARLPLLRSLKEALSVAAAAGDQGIDTGEVRASRTTRREFVKRAGIAGAGALAIGGDLAPLAQAARGGKQGNPSVVVGGGLAGLAAAYRLKRRGVRATVIEGNTRIGGRCWSGRDLFGDDQIIEHGGELIDTGHTAIRRLARDLGLHLDDVLRAEPPGTRFQAMWESTRAQDGEQGILVNYTGGATASALVGGDPLQKAAQFLAQLEPVLPGITSKWNGKATLDAWLGNPWSLGAYSYWKVGQYTAFAGAEGERSGNCHFAGEHTSIDFQGYLNGAVDTGISAAKEILADLRLPTAD